MEKLFDFVSLPSDAIEVKVIKRPKQKPLKKLKLNGATYYLSEDNENYYTFEYKSFTKDKVKSQVVASIFNKAKCKNVDWFELSQLYNDKINEYNQKTYVHSQYITDTILTEIYKLTR